MKSMKINVVMDGKTFREFAMFDNLRYRAIWKRPAFFAACFIVFSLLCFAMRGMREQAELLGAVLLIIGVGLPLVYFGMFFRTVEGQIKRLRLGNGRPFYTILLTEEPDGIVMSAKGAADQTFRWDGVECAYRADNAVYFYVAKGSALILPLKDVKAGGDALWSFLEARLGKDRLKVL